MNVRRYQKWAKSGLAILLAGAMMVGTAASGGGMTAQAAETESSDTVSTQKAVTSDAASLLFTEKHITSDLTLPTIGASGTPISWKSSNPSVLSNEGKVTRPKKEAADEEVTLKGTVKMGDYAKARNFTFVVLAESEMGPTKEFALDQVELLDDYYLTAQNSDIEFLKKFDNDRLLSRFRETAGLDTKKIAPYGGWEDGWLGGHSVGHYLTAIAQAVKATGNADLKEKSKQLIEGLERELDEYYEQKCGKGSLETYLIQNEIWHLSEINYQVRAGYQKYLREYYVDSTVRNYLLGIDRVKLRLIIENAQTLKGKWNAQNHPELLHDILFLRYHPNPAIAKRYEYTTDISKLVWDFRVKGSDICKQQILTVLEDIVQQKITMKECTRHLNGLKSVYEFCMQEQIEDLRYLTQKQFDKIENYGDTDYKKKCAKQELRACQEYIFCHAKNIAWDSTVWFMERLYLEEYRVNPSNPVKTISFMSIERTDNRELVQEYIKYCLGVTHLALSVIHTEFYRIQKFVVWLEETTEINLKQVSENEIKKYFQIIDYKVASYFNDIIIAIYQFYEYLQTKNIIKEVPFNYQYYLKKEILHHNDRSVEQETYESILKHLKDFPEKPRLILLHSMLLGLRISEVCCLKGNAYYWQGRDAWIQVYQIKMRTYKRIPIPEILYKIMKVYIKKYGIGAEDYIFQNQRGKAYHYSSFRWSMKKIFNENHELFQEYNFKSHDFRHTIATMFYEDGVPLQSVRDYLGHDYEEMTQQYVDYMPKRISRANQELFAKEGSSLASGIKRCKRGK